MQVVVVVDEGVVVLGAASGVDTAFRFPPNLKLNSKPLPFFGVAVTLWSFLNFVIACLSLGFSLDKTGSRLYLRMAEQKIKTTHESVR